MLGRTTLLLGLFSCLLAGCVQAEPPDEVPMGSSGQPIINGTKDVTHDAVVAVLGSQGACTGTIIHKDVANKKGYVLTAAHCMEEAPQLVVRGANYQTGTTYNVIDYKAHEQYNGQIHDIAMVTFTWNQNEPPVIPALKKADDDMAPGSTVDFVGYGVTQSSQNNSTRYHVSGKLDMVSTQTVHYNQSNSGPYANGGGPCFGDSGGPALYVAGGVETVAAVTSYGDENCAVYGVSSRVSAHEAWIADYIENGGGGGAQTCDQCSQASTANGGACAGAWNTCLNDNACGDLVDCLQGCQSQACVNQCATNNSAGLPKYQATLTCICDSGCPSECASAAFCQVEEAPECGLESANTSCQSCFENACCAQATACSKNNGCLDCLTDSNADPDCVDQNAQAGAFVECLADKCSSQCKVGGGTGGSGEGGAGVGGNGAGGDGVGGNGAGAGNAGGDGGSGAGGNGNDDFGTEPACGACRVGSTTPASNDGAAFALGALLFGLFAARRRR